uniref:Uncharacterized protein n=1 Tax=viral metagenome TaxID=1070528 RepID=A0A6C0J580_9ZZZZ
MTAKYNNMCTYRGGPRICDCESKKEHKRMIGLNTDYSNRDLMTMYQKPKYYNNNHR